MNPRRSEKGISVIELLLVVVIVGLLSAVAVPSVIKSKYAAYKGSAVGVLRTMHTNQLMYFARNGRFARLTELNSTFNETFGTTVGTRIQRNTYLYLMSPTPTDTSLRSGYQIVVYRTEPRYNIPVFLMNQSGTIQTLLP